MRRRVKFLFFLLFALAAGLLSSPTAIAGTNQWTSNGPYGGTINALAVSLNFASDGTLFAGSESGGVFKSTNGGASWNAANSGIPKSNAYVNSLAVSPNFAFDGTIFAGAYGTSGGVYKSTDGGASWTQVNTGLTSLSVRALAVSPNFATDGTIFAGTENSGVFKSTNGGANWTQITNGLTNQTVYSLAVSPNFATDRTVFTGTWGGGVYKSLDGGASWTPMSTGFGQDVYSLAISPNFASDGTVFAGTNGGGIYASTNVGVNWSPINNGFVNANAYYVHGLAISPSFASDRTIFAGTEDGFYKSTDGGTNWTQKNTGLTRQKVLSLACSPAFLSDSTVFSGSDGGGVFKSFGGGASWTQANTGINDQNVLSLTVSPDFAVDNTMFAGTNGGGVFKSTNGGGGWAQVNTGLSNWKINSVAVSPSFASDSTVFAGTNGGGVFKSTDGGANWTPINTGLINSYNILSLAVSPNFASDNTLLASVNTVGVFKSTNGGASWVQVNAFPGIDFLAASPNFASDNTVFAGSYANGVYKSTNGGANWMPIDTGLTNQTIYSLAVSPNFASDGTVFGGSSGTWGSGVFRSTDGGANWTQVNAGLANQHANALAISPNFATDKIVYAGTDGGVFKSTDGGANWTPINAGLTDQIIDSLAVSPNYASDHASYAGTGSGAFSYTVADTAPPIVTNVHPSGTINSATAIISADYSDPGTGINTASVAVYLNGTLLSNCTVSSASVSCAASGLSPGGYTITGSVADNAGNINHISGSFSVTRNYFWTLYDDHGGDNWVFMANPAQATTNITFGLTLGGAGLDLSGYSGGVVAPGASIEPRFGQMGGPLRASSQTGAGAVVSQRILWPKGGSSLEEVPGTDESRLSSDYLWTWYDQTQGRLNWVMVANPSASGDVYYQVSIAGGCAKGNASRCTSGKLAPLGDATGSDRAEPQFDGKIGGPVEVRGCSAALDAYGACPGTSENLISSQRVLSNGGLAFNEVPGTPAAELSSDYLWTWYDQTGEKLDWVMISNPSASQDMYFEVDIAASKVLDDASVNPATGSPYGAIAPGTNITPQFPGAINGPVEVKTYADQAHTQPLDSIASQRSLIGPSFEEVPGYRRSALASDYSWTWYDQQSAGALDWLMVSNPGRSTVTATVSFKDQGGNAQSATSSIPAGGYWNPQFDGKIGGPVRVTSTGGSVIASQRVLWNGYFNEVLGTVPG